MSVSLSPSRVYLASRWGRRDELIQYKATLETQGITVTSKWLTDANKQLESMIEDKDDLSSATGAARSRIAIIDFRDILAADTLIAFSEPRGTTAAGASTGGRHVEFGFALAMNKRIIVVGPRENIFHWCSGVLQVDTFEEAVRVFKSENPADEVTPFMFL